MGKLVGVAEYEGITELLTRISADDASVVERAVSDVQELLHPDGALTPEEREAIVSALVPLLEGPFSLAARAAAVLRYSASHG